MPKKLRKCLTEKGERERAKRQKQKNAIREAERRKNETPEQYRHSLSTVAQNTAKKRKNETEEERDERKLADQTAKRIKKDL